MKTTISLLIHHLNSETDFRPPAGGSLRRLRVAFFTFRVVSRIHARLEVRPRPDVAFLFFFVCFVFRLNLGCVIVGTALRPLTARDTRAMERTENWGRLFFF